MTGLPVLSALRLRRIGYFTFQCRINVSIFIAAFRRKMVKSIKVILLLLETLTSVWNCVILQSIKFVWIFTALCYFSPHNGSRESLCGFLCFGLGVVL